MAITISAQAFVQTITEAGCFQQISIVTEGPITKGYGYVSATLFVRFYMNQVTETIAFALIRDQERIWGIDHDKRRGWHQHPLEFPEKHEPIQPLAIADIMQELARILTKL
ncbi:MAG: hypothetical protein U0350_25375 [Caldilineaceae bacterium]